VIKTSSEKLINELIKVYNKIKSGEA